MLGLPHRCRLPVVFPVWAFLAGAAAKLSSSQTDKWNSIAFSYVCSTCGQQDIAIFSRILSNPWTSFLASAKSLVDFPGLCVDIRSSREHISGRDRNRKTTGKGEGIRWDHGRHQGLNNMPFPCPSIFDQSLSHSDTKLIFLSGLDVSLRLCRLATVIDKEFYTSLCKYFCSRVRGDQTTAWALLKCHRVSCSIHASLTAWSTLCLQDFTIMRRPQCKT